jgi:N-acetylglucosamine malate deacetylase 2
MKVLEKRQTAELESFFLSRSPECYADSPKCLLIAAHPDDETIGAGVLLSRRKDIKVVQVTDGSPLNLSDAFAAGFRTREEYAEARRKETSEALAVAGLGDDAFSNLHFIDQQVSFHLGELSNRIFSVVQQTKPEIVLTHAYEGGHPDHDSVAFACHMAHRMSGPDAPFRICEFTGYHAGNGGMDMYAFLPRSGEPQFEYDLNAEERNLKLRMAEKFTSQRRTLQPFCRPEAERFRVAPQYDFTRPPHEGRLWYENFNWGVDGKTWRKMASQTLREIFHP